VWMVENVAGCAVFERDKVKASVIYSQKRSFIKTCA
jgi:hypothetical protein